MKIEDIEEILRAHTSGSVSTEQAAEQIKHLSFEDIGYARVDHARRADLRDPGRDPRRSFSAPAKREHRSSAFSKSLSLARQTFS